MIDLLFISYKDWFTSVISYINFLKINTACIYAHAHIHTSSVQTEVDLSSTGGVYNSIQWTYVGHLEEAVLWHQRFHFGTQIAPAATIWNFAVAVAEGKDAVVVCTGS